MCGKCSIQHFFSSPGGPLSLSSSLENRGFLCFNAAMWISRKVLSVKRGIKKWSAVFRIGLIQGLAFRAETFLWIILDIFPTFILIASWLAVFHGKTTVGGQSLSQLIIYYLAVLIIINLAEVHFEERWVENVRYGKIDYYFVKPISLPTYIIVQALGSKLMTFVTFLLPFLALMFGLIHTGLITGFTFTFSKLFVFLAFLLLAFIFDSILSFFVVFAAFWMDEASSIGHFKWMVTGIFGGTLAPLTFYPQWIQKIAAFLPFKLALSTPAQLLARNSVLQSDLRELGLFFVYVVVCLFIIRFMWKHAQYKYTSAGG